MITKITDATITALHAAMQCPPVANCCPFAALCPAREGDRLCSPEAAAEATGEALEAVKDFMAGFDNGWDGVHSNYIPGGPSEAYLQGRAFYDRYVAGK